MGAGACGGAIWARRAKLRGRRCRGVTLLAQRAKLQGWPKGLSNRSPRPVAPTGLLAFAPTYSRHGRRASGICPTGHSELCTRIHLIARHRGGIHAACARRLLARPLAESFNSPPTDTSHSEWALHSSQHHEGDQSVKGLNGVPTHPGGLSNASPAQTACERVDRRTRR